MDETTVLSQLGQEEWYHQRFDGSPMYLSLIAEADTRPEPRIPAGVEARWLSCFYENGHADGYLCLSDINRGAAIMLDLARNSSTLSSDLMAQWIKDEQLFEEYFFNFGSTQLSTLSDEDLAAEFQKFRYLTVNRLTSTCIIDHFALGTDHQISKLIKNDTGVTQETEVN